VLPEIGAEGEAIRRRILLAILINARKASFTDSEQVYITALISAMLCTFAAAG
jgi:hypothetical protein